MLVRLPLPPALRWHVLPIPRRLNSLGQSTQPTSAYPMAVLYWSAV